MKAKRWVLAVAIAGLMTSMAYAETLTADGQGIIDEDGNRIVTFSRPAYCAGIDGSTGYFIDTDGRLWYCEEADCQRTAVKLED